MDLAYVCEWEKRPKSNHCPSIPLVCAWSCRNLIAFTTDLKNEEEKDLTHMVHILDTEHPWDVHSINSGHIEIITCLEWDQSGSRLLSADADGHIKCWSMMDHLANSWESAVGSEVEGDPKFSRVKFSPSLTLFGGKPMEGWIAVTISGLVTVSLLKPNGQVLTSTESLCRLRCRVALADIAFTGGGNIVVATSDGSSASPVQFYKVCVSVVNEKCKIDTEILPSLFMRCTTDPARKDKYPAITHLKFLARDMSEQISPTVGDKPPMILKWRILSATNDLDRVSAVALPKLPISLTSTDLKVASDTKFYPGLGLALAFHDGSVHIINRLSLQTMAVFYGSTSQRPVDEQTIKRQRASGPLLSMFRISPSMGHVLDMNISLRHLLFLLEYCMVTGYDWWDILLHVQPGMVQNLVLSTRIIAMKASLCKLSSSTVARVCDYHAKLFLIAISCTLKSLLRPPVLNTPDKTPGDRLTEICAKITDIVGWGLCALFARQSPEPGETQMPHDAGSGPASGPVRPGHSFLRDGASLGMLRELMVMIRIWGLLKPSCLPIYTATSDTQDSMSLLFRLLTKFQLLIPNMDWLPVNDAIISKLQNKQPVRLQFGKPLGIVGHSTSVPCDAFTSVFFIPRTTGYPKIDHLRRLHLGAYPTEECKSCTRCGCVTMLRSPNKTTAVKQWEQRWIKNCLCGGLWRRMPLSYS
ncbi:hypothetical protein Chor_017154 [Crotalus horridus]